MRRTVSYHMDFQEWLGIRESLSRSYRVLSDTTVMNYIVNKKDKDCNVLGSTRLGSNPDEIVLTIKNCGLEKKMKLLEKKFRVVIQ
ncbi:MAG: hypothetical protein AABY10_02930 [Nanoarchaeota archaeon]